MGLIVVVLIVYGVLFCDVLWGGKVAAQKRVITLERVE